VGTISKHRPDLNRNPALMLDSWNRLNLYPDPELGIYRCRQCGVSHNAAAARILGCPVIRPASTFRRASGD
jgi:hypothetical protein